MFNDADLAHFKALLIAANNDSTIDAVVWAQGVPWIDNEGSKLDDTWVAFPEQRIEIAQFISKLTRLRGRFFMLCGDMHGVAFDDGSHNLYHLAPNEVTENVVFRFFVLYCCCFGVRLLRQTMLR